MNEERTGRYLWQVEHIRAHLWHIYSTTVNNSFPEATSNIEYSTTAGKSTRISNEYISRSSTTNIETSSTATQTARTTISSETSNRLISTDATIYDFVSKTCNCDCHIHEVINNYNLVRNVPVNKITDALIIDKKKLSSTKRKLTSAPDKRTSASVVGYTGVLVLTLVLGIVIVSDIVNYISCTKKRKTGLIL